MLALSSGALANGFFRGLLDVKAQYRRMKSCLVSFLYFLSANSRDLPPRAGTSSKAHRHTLGIGVLTKMRYGGFR